MRRKKYISPEIEKLDVELIRDCLDASAPGGQGIDLGDDWWDTPNGNPDSSNDVYDLGGGYDLFS